MLLKNLLLIVAITATSLTSCKKSKPEVLPEITQEGKNTFGCLIDGQVFLPHTSFNNYARLSASYMAPPSPLLSISAPNDKKDGKSLSFYAKGLTVVEGATYKLGREGDDGVVSAKCIINIGLSYTLFSSSTSLPGEIHISKLTSDIISGTFSYDAVSPDGKKIEIRDGRFDLRLN